MRKYLWIWVGLTCIAANLGFQWLALILLGTVLTIALSDDFGLFETEKASKQGKKR